VTRVVTAGETMALLDPVDDGELELGGLLRLRIAGAESNFAVGLTRLGVPVTWISRLGADRLGALVRAALAGEGVDLRWVREDPDAPTGLFYKWRADGRTSVAYHRRGSAASRLAPADVPDEALAGAELVHLTGITMALGAEPRALVLDVARRARAAGATVVFDPNYRPALWDGPQAAAAAMEPVLEHVDWYLCGAGEGEALLGASDARGVLDALAARGVSGAVVRVGERGALVAAGGDVRAVTPSRREEVVDEIGAGDAFAAGFAYGLLHGWPPERCTHAANAIAARALRGTGDWETLPRLDEVRELLEPGRA
jgi:2-dehydro-3-deoxygluconokinase